MNWEARAVCAASASGSSHRVTHVAAENTKCFAELAEAMLRLSDAQLRTNQNVDTVIARIDEMQSEVRGLQTENRRILDRIFPGQS